ncbi:MAG TPA: substrate-binding domain-containing protein [Anaerolineales bacterium]|jgi:hypothetical protein
MTFKFGLLFSFSMLVAACNPQLEADPNLHIALSPSAQPVSTALAACIPSVENLSAILDVRYANFVDLKEVDFFIQLGEAVEEPVFAAQVASEDIVVILHPDNELDLSKSQLANLFSGRVQDWSELGGQAGVVSLWVGPQSDEGRQVFEGRVLLGSPVSGAANLATNPEDLLAAVAADKAAAGILPAAWVDETVRAIELEVELPVLALAAEEPSGAARQLLACLQGEAGQAALAELYAPLEP